MTASTTWYMPLPPHPGGTGPGRGAGCCRCQDRQLVQAVPQVLVQPLSVLRSRSDTTGPDSTMLMSRSKSGSVPSPVSVTVGVAVYMTVPFSGGWGHLDLGVERQGQEIVILVCRLPMTRPPRSWSSGASDG